ncbi:MAG: nickel pincer cofactor biosynthesis protein LarC [Bryobacterales bacterium]|nr:nickel pincer cofactor biosynthesis protein LarC [Bryobacteraceae bacterium]MDW8353347.1 nickel pincer cofactor biosynthesis protein LarC [Bryobacterales bacterium]
MKICYLDAFSGISGDMLVGALADAGAPPEALLEGLRGLGLEASYEFTRTRRAGIAATKFHVRGGRSANHRHLHQILDLIERSGLPERVRRNAAAVFQNLGQAEAKIHGLPIEKVHFHEVGAVDSISDIVGACLGLELLGVEAVHCSAVNVGSGTVQTEHGTLPVPAPATAELLRGKPVYAQGPAAELTTPTGAALAVTLACEFGPMPPLRISQTGYGAGERDFPQQANVLRVIVGEASGATEAATVCVIEANLDDASPQVLAYATERLFEGGALDVTLAPLQMKKGRPGTLIQVVARPEDRERLASILFAETTTLGLRWWHAERRVQERRWVEVETRYGRVRIKVGESSWAPEYDDCQRLAREAGVPLKEVLAEASFTYLKTQR